jgi:outer membrane protein, heavy metal efflux system
MSFLSARYHRACLGWACVAVQVLSAAFSADVFTEPSELSLASAIDAALKHNPALAVSSYELKTADARVTHAKLGPKPEVSLQLENFAGSGAVRGVDALESTLALSRILELGGKRASRVDAATIGRELSGIDRQAKQLDILADVTRRFIDVVLAQQTIVLADRAAKLAEQTLAAITVRVAAARSPQAEQSRASIALTRARIEQERAANKLQGVRRALAALWGARSASFGSAAADLFALPQVASFEALTARLQGNPDFLRFATESRLREAELRFAQAQSNPDLNVSLGIRRFETTGDTALVAGVSIPLSLGNRNRATLREAELRQEQLRVQSRTALLQTEAALFGLYQEMSSARMRVTTLRSDALPQADAALEQTQYGFDRGRFSYMELASAQQELLALQGASLEAAADYHRLVAEIERLTGEPLVDDNLEGQP